MKKSATNYLREITMASCDYYVLQDLYEAIDTKLEAIASKIEEKEIDFSVDELDIDLDNLEAQLKIANKLKLLDSIGTNIMSEEAQQAAYSSLVNELFGPTSFGVSVPDPMEEEEGEF